MLNKIILIGASGLIGSKLLDILLKDNFYTEVLILVRRKLPVTATKLHQLIVNDFNKLDDFADSINGHALFCCIGSTQSKTPNLEAYRKIDHDYPVKLADLALKGHIQQFHLVSALGANPNSSNFYTKMKGETERDMMSIRLNTLHIYRPALLTGDRKEFRIGERIAKLIMNAIDPLLFGRLKKYRSIPAETVAMAMYNQSKNNTKGLFIHSSDQIKNLA